VVMDDLGTDALRFTLLVGSAPGNDMNLSIKKVEANRNFANKIWNAGRFVTTTVQGINLSPSITPDLYDWTLADSWIWARLQRLIRDAERLFQSNQYGEAGRQVYEFFWGDFADWYLEIAKLQLAEGSDRAFYTAYTLVRVLDTSLRLLHPFTPFITEELWGHLKTATLKSSLEGTLHNWPEALIIASWPMPSAEEDWEAGKIADFSLVQNVVRAIRNLRSEKNVPPRRRIPATLVSASSAEILRQQAATIATLSGIDPARLAILETIQAKPVDNIALVIGAVEIYLPLAGMIDTAEERSRLEKDLAEIQTQIKRLEDLLASPFAEKAPPAVVQKERNRLSDFRETAGKIQAQLNMLA